MKKEIQGNTINTLTQLQVLSFGDINMTKIYFIWPRFAHDECMDVPKILLVYKISHVILDNIKS
jgi:hypothetical protein